VPPWNLHLDAVCNSKLCNVLKHRYIQAVRFANTPTRMCWGRAASRGRAVLGFDHSRVDERLRARLASQVAYAWIIAPSLSLQGALVLPRYRLCAGPRRPQRTRLFSTTLKSRWSCRRSCGSWRVGERDGGSFRSSLRGSESETNRESSATMKRPIALPATTVVLRGPS
jgi:hypothetical protein